MTKAAVLHEFFSGFGIPAYAASAVPDDAVFPWLTYELVTSAWDGGEVGITVNLWYYTTSEKTPNDKAQEISTALGTGGAVLPCDGGFIWLKRGAPWCQSLTDDADSQIKRRYINVSAEYLTVN